MAVPETHHPGILASTAPPCRAPHPIVGPFWQPGGKPEGPLSKRSQVQILAPAAGNWAWEEGARTESPASTVANNFQHGLLT